jgi:hypothetical protein
VVVAAALGVATLAPQLAQQRSGTSTAGSTAADRAAGAAPSANVPTLASGTDYQPGTLGTLATGRAAPAAPGNQRSGAAEGQFSNDSAGTVPGQLTPLTQPATRDACLAAITAKYGGRVVLIDYARFEGRPALIVVLAGSRAAPNGRWVVVVGPQCGGDGTIADERYAGSAG